MSSTRVVLVDAGHGGIDPGAVNGSRCEKDDNLRLALAVQKLLQARGVTVIMSRVDDTYPNLTSRTNKANAVGADLFLSLHRNSHTTPSANGTEIWVYTNAGAAEEAMAGAVLEELAAAGVQSNRGVKKGNYHVLRESAMPAMLVELGFISNQVDNSLFDERFDQYAQAVANGVCTALGVVDGGESTVHQEYYRVQVGAFTQRANAEAFLESVQGMGLEAFLVAPAAVTTAQE